MKILIGYDGSPSSHDALYDLVNAGLPDNAQVRILFALNAIYPIESIMPLGDGISFYPTNFQNLAENQKVFEKQAQVQVKEARTKLLQLFPNWKITSKVVEDSAAHAIISEAENWKPHLICMGSRGWNAFGDLILGSVAENVLKHAPCSVRLGKNQGRGKMQSQKLLIAYDGSSHADEVIKKICARKWQLGTKAKLIAVSEFQLQADEISKAIHKNAGEKNEIEFTWPWMQKKLTSAKTALEKIGVKTVFEIALGEPRRKILDESKKFRATTIFIGSRGLRGFQRFLIGSVSSAVASHATCSVEIVRSPSELPAA